MLKQRSAQSKAYVDKARNRGVQKVFEANVNSILVCLNT